MSRVAQSMAKSGEMDGRFHMGGSASARGDSEPIRAQDGLLSLRAWTHMLIVSARHRCGQTVVQSLFWDGPVLSIRKITK